MVQSLVFEFRLGIRRAVLIVAILATSPFAAIADTSSRKNSFFTFFGLFCALAPLTQALAADRTVVVDFAQPQPETRSASGFLTGLTETKPAIEQILPLQPQQWRMTNYLSKNGLTINPTIYDRIVKSGARLQLLFGLFWRGPQNPGRPWPYEDYVAYENFVTQLARANKSLQIPLWDVWNEPDRPDLGFWGGTIEQFFETYRRTYQILRRELGPEVLIGGPSLSHYDENLLTRFLDFCNANGCEVNFLSWHELSDREITTIPNRISRVRSLFVDNPVYAGLNIREIQINEVIGAFNQYNPAAVWGYFYNLEEGGADGANKSCWPDSIGDSNCRNGSLDGLVTPSAGQPRAAWWAQKLYADGVGSRVVSVSADPKIVALGSSGAAYSSKAQVLLGYFRGFPGDVPPVADITLELDNLDSIPFIGQSIDVRIGIEKIPNSGEEAVENLTQVSDQIYPIVDGSAKLLFQGVRPDDAYVLTIAPNEADLAISITDSPDPVMVGDNLSYTIAVNNIGPSPADSLSVSLNLPNNANNVSASGVDWNCGISQSTVICSRFSLAVGATSAITMNLTAPIQSGQITIAGTVGGHTNDPNLTNNTALQTTAVITGPLTVGSESPPLSEVGVAYGYDLPVSGGAPPYSAKITKGALPLGLGLGSSKISGTPSLAGTASFTVQLTDQSGVSVSRSSKITVLKALSISTQVLKGGAVGKRYKVKLKAQGGKGPFAWSLLSGAPPAGLTFNGSTGEISGIPTVGGSSDLTFQATDIAAGTVSKTLTLTINP